MKFQTPALALAAILAASAAQAAQLVVLDSKGPIANKLPAGSVVDDATLDLAEHDQVTVMSASGEAIKVEGPHHGPVGAPAGGDPGMLKKLAEVMQDRKDSFGATRSIGFQPPGGRKEDPWAIDGSFTGTACTFDGRPTKLWLPGTPAPGHVTVLDETTHKSSAFDWPAGVNDAAWPADLPAIDGDRYTISWGTEHRTVTLKHLPAAATPGAGSLAAAGAGCTGQSVDLLKVATKRAHSS